MNGFVQFKWHGMCTVQPVQPCACSWYVENIFETVQCSYACWHFKCGVKSNDRISWQWNRWLIITNVVMCRNEFCIRILLDLRLSAVKIVCLSLSLSLVQSWIWCVQNIPILTTSKTFQLWKCHFMLWQVLYSHT